MKLSVVIPARNEEDCIEGTIIKLEKFLPAGEGEILVVNDHSTDRTREIVEKLTVQFSNLKLLDNEKEPGFANALITGFEGANGGYVVPVMADGCDDPSVIPLMWEKAEEGYDLVCGSRYIKGGGKVGGPKIQGFFSACVGKTLYRLINIPTRDISNAFKMYRTNTLKRIKLQEKGFAVSMEAALKFYFSGAKITEVPTVWYGRKKGQSKFRLSRTFPYVRLYLWALRRKFSAPDTKASS